MERAKKMPLKTSSQPSSDTITFSLPKLKQLNMSTVFLVLFSFVAGLLIGSLYTKIQYLEKKTPATTAATTTPQTAAQPAAPKATIEQIRALFTDKNITFGDKNSKNLLVEVADPSCPWCHVAGGKNPELARQMGKILSTDGGDYVAPEPEMRQLIDSGKAALVWIYTPGHGNGEMGTKALYCAYEQGKFWEAHDLLMNNQGYDLLNNVVKNDKTKSQELTDYLTNVVDAAALKTCLDSGKYDSKLSDDTAVAGKLGISSTPGFYINTTNFAGAYAWGDMKSAIQ